MNKFGNEIVKTFFREISDVKFDPIVSRGNYTSFELVEYTKEYAEGTANYAYENGLSWLNIDDCVDTLKNIYKIPQNDSLLIRKQDYSRNFTKKQFYSSDFKTTFGVSKILNLGFLIFFAF